MLMVLSNQCHLLRVVNIFFRNDNVFASDADVIIVGSSNL